MQEQSMVGKPSNLGCAQINAPVGSVATPIPVKSWTARRDAEAAIQDKIKIVDSSSYSGSCRPKVPGDWANEMLRCFDAHEAMTKFKINEEAQKVTVMTKYKST